MLEALPNTPEPQRALAIDLISTILRRVGKDLSERAPSSAEIETFSDGIAAMFCAYLCACAEQGNLPGRADQP